MGHLLLHDVRCDDPRRYFAHNHLPFDSERIGPLESARSGGFKDNAENQFVHLKQGAFDKTDKTLWIYID